MRGILLDSFYKVVFGMKLLICCLALVGTLIVFFIDNQLIVEMYAFVIFFTISVYSLLINANELEAGWSIYELILPVKRENILKCKYAIYLFWVLIAVIITIMYLCGVVIFKGSLHFDLGIKDIESIFIVAFSFSLQLCAWFYIVWYMVDFSKKEVSIIISVLLSVFGIMSCMYILNYYRVKLEVGRIIMVSVSGAFIVVSYIVSMRKYIGKEY